MKGAMLRLTFRYAMIEYVAQAVYRQLHGEVYRDDPCWLQSMGAGRITGHERFPWTEAQNGRSGSDWAVTIEEGG